MIMKNSTGSISSIPSEVAAICQDEFAEQTLLCSRKLNRSNVPLAPDFVSKSIDGDTIYYNYLALVKHIDRSWLPFSEEKACRISKAYQPKEIRTDLDEAEAAMVRFIQIQPVENWLNLDIYSFPIRLK